MQANNAKKPFTFSAPLSSKRDENPDEQSLYRFVSTTFNEQFLQQVNKWKDLHEQSTENLQQFLNYHTLLSKTNEDLKTKTYLMKLEKFHTKLLENVKNLSSILLEMRKIVNTCQTTIQRRLDQTGSTTGTTLTDLCDRGEYRQLNSVLDYIQFMNTYISMHEQEFQMKHVIVQSLHEEESPFVLNTYMISWKKQPFRDMDKLRGMEMEWNRDEKMRNKLGIAK